jgi:hypothetical protein
MDWGGKLVFICFNPDGKGFSMDDKHARLAAEINEQVRRVEAGENTELCSSSTRTLLRTTGGGGGGEERGGGGGGGGGGDLKYSVLSC